MFRSENGFQSTDGVPAQVVKAFGIAIAARRLYPVEHPAFGRALERLVITSEPLFERDGRVSVECEEDQIRVNGAEVLRPRGLVLSLSHRMRRRLMKAVSVTAELEPDELGAICTLLAQGAREVGIQQLKRELGGLRSPHVEVVELAYEDPASGDRPVDASALEEEWYLGLRQVTPSVLANDDAISLVRRLEGLPDPTSEGETEGSEEIDVLRLVSGNAAERLGDALPADSRQMELLLSHVLQKLEQRIQPEGGLRSSSRLKRVADMIVQHILSKTPDLIASIAENTGPSAQLVTQRYQGRAPHEVLQQLFMRAPRGVETAQDDTSASMRSGEDKSLPRPEDVIPTLQRLSDEALEHSTFPSMVDPAEVIKHYTVFLARWSGDAGSATQRSRVCELFRRLISDETAVPRFSMAQDVLAVLEGTAASISLDARRELFANLDFEKLTDYLYRSLPDRSQLKRGLCALSNVLGSQAGRVVFEYCLLRWEDPATRDLLEIATDALGPQLVPAALSAMKDKSPASLSVCMSLCRHLDRWEQTTLLAAILSTYGDKTPPEAAIRLARSPSPLALLRLREWLASVSASTRGLFADTLLSTNGAEFLPITADIAAAEGPWKGSYAHAEVALTALGRDGNQPPRQVLLRLSKSGRWSLSRRKRKLARIARDMLGPTHANLAQETDRGKHPSAASGT